MMPSVAIILPAYNEELTIVDTMKDFFSACPEAEIYVIDNASVDCPNELAQAACEELGCERLPPIAMRSKWKLKAAGKISHRSKTSI